jgi:hypothetical protein
MVLVSTNQNRCKKRYVLLMTEQLYDQNYAKVGSSWVLMGVIGALALGPGWVLGRDLRPKLGYAEVYEGSSLTDWKNVCRMWCRHSGSRLTSALTNLQMRQSRNTMVSSRGHYASTPAEVASTATSEQLWLHVHPTTTDSG